MRAIEKEMLQAIHAKKSWQKSNTSVYYEYVNRTYGRPSLKNTVLGENKNAAVLSVKR